jgi:hypothetical protein
MQKENLKIDLQIRNGMLVANLWYDDGALAKQMLSQSQISLQHLKLEMNNPSPAELRMANSTHSEGTS